MSNVGGALNSFAARNAEKEGERERRGDSVFLPSLPPSLSTRNETSAVELSDLTSKARKKRAGGRSSSRVSAPKLAVGMKEKEGRKGGKCDRPLKKRHRCKDMKMSHSRSLDLMEGEEMNDTSRRAIKFEITILWRTWTTQQFNSLINRWTEASASSC